MKIDGKIVEWDVPLGQFKIDTPIGSITIMTEEWDDILIDTLVTAMKERKTIHIEVEE